MVVDSRGNHARIGWWWGEVLGVSKHSFLVWNRQLFTGLSSVFPPESPPLGKGDGGRGWAERGVLGTPGTPAAAGGESLGHLSLAEWQP